MTQKLKRLKALERLAGMQREAELAKYATLAARDRALGAQIEALASEEADTRDLLAREPQSARSAIGYLGFLSLEEDRLQGARSSLGPELTAQKAAAAKALGRHDVLQKLTKKR